ncbi:MAG TPA: MarR family winged helix-turn-helix transcriptional regulator [Spirochaetales bacterium]|nr:MarR family winged helix-turn-helix transcriptional regulator [Spirochaetales bacterium]
MHEQFELARSLRDAYQRLLRSDRKWLSAQTLSPAEARLFAVLGEGGKISGLADALELTAGAVTRLVDVLERRTLVERIRSGADRRVVFVRPTLAGLAAWREWEGAADAGFASLVSALGVEDAKAYARLLLATSAHLESIAAARTNTAPGGDRRVKGD